MASTTFKLGLGLTTLAIVAAGTALVFVSASEPRHDDATSGGPVARQAETAQMALASSQAAPREPRRAAPSDAPAPSVRQRVHQLVEDEVSALRGAADLDAYLARLESRARGKGQVTALEVEPGLEAIAALGPELGAEAAGELEARFTTRMTQLSQQLRGVDEDAEDAQLAGFDPGAALDHIEALPPGARQSSINALAAKLAHMDPLQAEAYQARLDSLLPTQATADSR